MDQASKIYEEGGLFTIAFTDFPDNIGGYEWESAIKTACKKKNIDISKVEFDSESDMFAVYSQKKEHLQPIASVIDMLVSKPKNLKLMLDSVSECTIEDDISAPEEFIENLECMGFDLSKSRQIAFYLEFENAQHAKAACKECYLEGYKCLLDLRVENQIHFAAIANFKLTINTLNEKIKYFQYISKTYEGKFDFYDDYENEDLIDGIYSSEWFEYKG